jgi:hypothetical protein
VIIALCGPVAACLDTQGLGGCSLPLPKAGTDGSHSSINIRQTCALMGGLVCAGLFPLCFPSDSPMTPVCVPMGGEGGRYLGPKFGPKHHGIGHNQAAPNGIAGWRDTLKSLHKMTA